MIDVVEASRYVGVEHVFGFVLDSAKDSFDRVVTGASGAKTVAVRLKHGFPLGFHGEFCEGLPRPLIHGGNTQRAFLFLARLWDIDPSDWFGSRLRPVVWVNVLGQGQSVLRGEGFHSIDTACFLALVLLRHPPHSYEPGRLGLHQQLLKFVDCSCIATLTGSENAFLYVEDMLL